MLPESSFAPIGSVMAVKTTGMSLSSAAAKQAVAEGVAIATIISTFSAEKVAPICVAMLSSNPAFW